MITTEIKEFVIITFSKEKHFITKKQFQFLAGSANGRMALIGDMSINTSNIATMMTIREYYNQFPREKPMAVITHSALPAINYQKKYLSSEERISKALVIWRRQRDNEEVKKQSGGLLKLIKWAEDRLVAIRNVTE